MSCELTYKKLRDAGFYYLNKGYKVGMTKGKSLIYDTFFSTEPTEYWDGISLVLRDMVCVDIDAFISIDNARFPLPPTLKERSPKGLHYFYNLPRSFKGSSCIKWQPYIDILTFDNTRKAYRRNKNYQGHVLCSPTPGYTRLGQGRLPHKNELPTAPAWVLDALCPGV